MHALVKLFKTRARIYDGRYFLNHIACLYGFFNFLKKGGCYMKYRTISEELRVTGYKKAIEREVEEYFEAKGFCLIEPRIFQRYDEYIPYNQDSSKTVKVVGGDSRIFILRPDITTNILGEIFSKWDGQPPLKVYYNSKIYLNRPGGKILQNHQMGVESLGDDIPKTDQEVVEMAGAIMESLKKPFILELGSSKYMDGLFKEMGLWTSDEMEIRRLIGRKNKDDLRIKLEALGLENTILERVLQLEGDMGEVIQKAKDCSMNNDMKKALEAVERLHKEVLGKELIHRIRFDLSMMPDQNYYDGIILKGYCSDTPQKILSGGRYDRLTKDFGRAVTAIGFMVDMDLVTQIRMEGEI